MVGEAQLWSPTCSTFEAFVVRCVVMKKNWALSVDQCWLQAWQFSMHLINLLSILLRCDGFTRVHKAVVYQTDSRSPNSDYDPFSGATLALASALELLLGPTTMMNH